MANEIISKANIKGPVETIGSDMVPPYGVYVNGTQVAKFATEAEACALHNELRQLLPRREVGHGSH